ncbi:LMBR1-like membrane protein isoform 1 [Hibiscus syriacus]|uniref:LMBR1-like membrane protein isoform 1 n=2 Tax=Hibiscus syriacus TaxID=106335 RepID=A0A6A2ZZA3_HIBSY|nr:LMBR1-like membrane protein isoform 1 [Hibiscus syriacus]
MSTSPSRRHPDSHKRISSGEPVGITWPSSSCCTMKFGANGVKKSRSIAFETGNFYDEGGEKEVKDGKKKEKGFWSKLLGLKGKNKDVLRHSKSMRLIDEVNMVS